MLFKRTIPVLIAFACGLWFAIQYFVPTSWSDETLTQASNWYKIIVGFAAVLGLYSLVHLHWTKIRRGAPGWGYSVIVYVGLIPTLVVGLAGEVEKTAQIVAGRPFSFADFQAYDAPGLTYTEYFTWAVNHVYTPALATMFSLLAFFIASAAYRTFRARTWQSACLLIAAVIVMLGQLPVAARVSEWIPTAADWLMMWPNMAAKRGIMLGVSLGIVATALRIIFGIERAYLGGE